MTNAAHSAAWEASSANVARPPLEGVLVVELGERLGASVCGTILAQLGANVVFVEPTNAAAAVPARGKWVNRACAAAGKLSLVVGDDGSDRKFLDSLLSVADVVLLSTDLPSSRTHDFSADQIICDVTAFGAGGPLAGAPHSEALIQAAAGLADTTGNPDGPPCLIGFPFCEYSAGLYAAAATLVALRVRSMQGFGQHVDIALYDCAVGALSTFLPFHAIGKPATRAGNSHSLAAPWNAYRASDGWVLICTATDDQWRRLCTLFGKPSLARAKGFATNSERVARRAEVDRFVQDWVSAQPVMKCIERLSAIEIACGPILTVPQLAGEPNLLHRHTVRRLFDPVDQSELAMPSSPFALSLPIASNGGEVPRPGEHNSRVRSLVAGRGKAQPLGNGMARSALSGMRVLEIGQYTTAPLVGRHLGALGADVYKIEPPGGEGSRGWPPVQGNRGYFFVFSNSDKRSVELDLRNEAHRARFRSLIQDADVLVENLKPGSLERLGFGPAKLLELNPKLVYCAISGFGASSSYPGRPAFDTVVQAMSGFMDLTRVNGVPTKAGISAADILGGAFGLLSILAAVLIRDQSGRGHLLDISMQDAAVAATAGLWNAKPAASRPFIVRCADGFACLEPEAIDSEAVLVAIGLTVGDCERMTRERLVEACERAGIPAAAVRSVGEVACSPQTIARQLIIEIPGDDGRRWPLLNSPLRLSRTPPLVGKPIGELGEANSELRISSPEE
ncbi:MAG: CoA transferase [Betaproteobacteria bacterium]|nr:CoA transferase [Betaproteobacteria bacterium]